MSVRGRLSHVVVRYYRPPKHALSTKKSVFKRFRLKPNGKIKYWPSQLGGKSRVLTPKGNFKHLAALLLPSHGTRAKWGQEKSAKPDLVDVLRAAQKHFKQVKGRDLTKDELPKLVAAIKGARFVGNHVYAGSDEGVLKFQ